jgi:hypothetical protein
MTLHGTTQHYIGTKMTMATPMTRLAYNQYRGWELPADENGADEGYLVEYLDGGASNHPDHKGYISWSPKAVHDGAYLPIGQVGHLPPHQQRVIGEQVQLADKLEKLGAALNGALKGKVSADEFSLLCEQERVMREYDEILRRRIANFGSAR